MMKEKSSKIFFLIIFFCFILRLPLLRLPTLQIDMNIWQAWGGRMAEFGPRGFYSDNIWTNHLPGFLYLLWFIKFFWLFLEKTFFLLPKIEEIIFKIPAMLSDLFSALLIFSIIRKKLNDKTALLGSLLYLFNPAVIFNSTIWGQYDGYLNLLLLVTYLFIKEGKVILGSLSYAFALLTKPQTIALLPIIPFINKKVFLNKFFTLMIIFFVSIFFLCLPFFKNPILELPKILIKMSHDYPYTTVNAFNFWYLFANWKSDQLTFGIFTYQLIGIFLFLFFEGLIILPFILKKKNINLFFSISLTFFNFFLFITRMHERYLLPFFVFFLLAGILSRSLFLILSYLVLSLSHFINLFYVYWSYQVNKPNYTYAFIKKQDKALVIINLLFFLLLLLFYLRKSLVKKEFLRIIEKGKKKFFQVFSFNQIFNLSIIFILFFAFFSRVINLQHPTTHIFDEVYHAFTAQEMYKGNLKAWEWWNTPPKGFAYEWTHPPIAKHLMFLGIAVFGSNSFGWRFPATIFGTGVIFLIYLLGKELFNKRVGLLALILASFEGLLFVMSRIGMSDIYFVFFSLAAILAKLKKKVFLSAVFFGFALGTKWTAFYLLPVIFSLNLFNFKFTRKYLLKIFGEGLLFIFTAIFIYLLVYLPFLTTHSFDKFVELQKQMWWYHTGLKATHDYQSKAYTWPLMLRPVWFYVNYQKENIANIYSFGNPLILWGGLVVLPYVLIFTLLKKSKLLFFTLFAYFAFWLPWIFSPRIMFLYHYLPSLPFLCLLLAWYLEKILKKRRTLVFVYLFLVVLAFIFFYPHLTGLLVPKNINQLYYWLPSWK